MRSRRGIVLMCTSLFLLFSLSVEAKEDPKLKERVAALEEQIVQLDNRVSDLAPEGFDELREYISNLESAFGPWETTVDCGADESLQAALNEADNRVGPVIITVEGMCSEEVVIRRDDVTLRGGSPGSGIQDPSGNGIPLILEAAQRVHLEDLELIDGEVGLAARSGVSFSASNLRVAGAIRSGVQVYHNASGEISTLTVSNGGPESFGVEVFSEGSLSVFDGTISDGSIGAFVHRSGNLDLFDVTIDWFDEGIEVMWGASASLRLSRIKNCGSAGEIHGSIDVSGSEIIDNTWPLYAKPGGSAFIQGSVIQEIGGESNSSIEIINTTINGSVSVGIHTSLVFYPGTVVLGRVNLRGISVLEAYPTADPASIQIGELYCDEDIVTQVMIEGDVQIGPIVGCRGYP